MHRKYRWTVVAFLGSGATIIALLVFAYRPWLERIQVERHVNQWLAAQRDGKSGHEFWDDLARTPLDDPQLSPYGKSLVEVMRWDVQRQRQLLRQYELQKLRAERPNAVDVESPDIQLTLDRAVAEWVKGRGPPYEEPATVVEPSTIAGITTWEIRSFEDVEICNSDRQALFLRQARAECMIKVIVTKNGRTETQVYEVGLFKNNGQWGIVNLVGG